MLLREFFEAATDEAAIIFGRFNPAHKGHKAAWEVAAKSPVWYVGTNKSTIGPKDPLPFDVKVKVMETIWPEVAGHIVAETSWLTLASMVYEKHRPSTLYCCTDEDWVTKTVIQYNGKEGPHGYYDFPSIEQKPTPRLSSATDLRQSVMVGDREAFSKAAGVSADVEIDGTPFFDLVAKYLLPYANTKSGKSSTKSAKLKEINKSIGVNEELRGSFRNNMAMSTDWQSTPPKGIPDDRRNILLQLKRNISLHGNYPIEFDDGTTLELSSPMSQEIMYMIQDMLPREKHDAVRYLVKSKENFINFVKSKKKTNEALMPKSAFAGSSKNKLGPAAHLTGKMKRPARRGDLVGGAMESLEEEQLDELNVTQTLQFIQQAHGDQLYGKLPYWKHPRAVALTGKKIFGKRFSSDAVKTAFLHDVVEDTHYSLSELSKLDFTPQVIEAVGLLTKDKSLTYAQNIEKIINSGNPLAMMVKYADNYENYTGDKSSWDPVKAASSQKKYLKSLNMLGDKLGVKAHVTEAGDTVSPVGGKKGTGPALGGYDMDAMRQATGTMGEVAKVQISRDPDDFGAYVRDAGKEEQTVMLPIKQINQVLEPDDLHQTKPGAPERIKNMVMSIRQGKQLPPILVRRHKLGYQVLDGHHRFKAYKIAKATKIPVRIVDPKNVKDI